MFLSPLAIAPPPPGGVTLTTESATSIRVQWISVLDALGYEITYTPGQGACKEIEGGRVLVGGMETTSHTLQGLEEFTRYSIVVRSQGVEGTGTPSIPVSQTTRQNGA